MPMPFVFDPMMLLFLAPALILAMIAQVWVSSAYARGQQAQTNMTGYAAARHILDAAGLRLQFLDPTSLHLELFDPSRLGFQVLHTAGLGLELR